MKRLKAVIDKEFAHILRDPASLTIVILMPVLMMFIFGYAINFDLEKVEAGIINYSKGETARKLIEKFQNNRYFTVTHLRAGPTNPVQQGEHLLKSGKLKEIIIIPADFAQKVKTNRRAEIGIVIDGSDANVANLVYQYNELILLDFIAEYRQLDRLLKVSTQIYFNPELKSSVFFIPGLIAILLLMISALLTSLSIAREKESGSIDLIFISPLRSPEIIVGKTIPYIVVALIDEAVILLFATLYFGIPIKGNLLVLFLFSLLYVVCGLSLGILVSTAASSQKTAMFAALLITLLPSIMLSGFIFPLESMGVVLRSISTIVPATYFLKIIRGVVVKGAELKHFLVEGGALVLFSLVLIAAATAKFNQNRKKSK
jgi:ABC-2 type transport system permease protein